MQIHIPDGLKGEVATRAIIGVVSLSTGLGLGYILGKRRGEVTVVPAEDVTHEPEDANDDQLRLGLYDNIVQEMEYRAEGPSDPYESPEIIKEVSTTLNGEEIVVDNGRSPDVVQNVVPPPRRRVFDGVTEWDNEAELSTRGDGPYIIHKDEFFADEMGYLQHTVTYYQGDDILAGEDDRPIFGHKDMLGELKFGHGSGDPNVVYIRNQKLEIEWEVLLHTGRYEVEIVGLEIEQDFEIMDDKELHHSVRRFRAE